MNLEAFMNHKRLKLFIALLLGIYSTAAPLAGADRSNFPSPCHRPELEYLRAVNQAAPPPDPQLLFLLMAHYSSANLHASGAELFSSRLTAFTRRVTDVH